MKTIDQEHFVYISLNRYVRSNHNSSLQDSLRFIPQRGWFNGSNLTCCSSGMFYQKKKNEWRKLKIESPSLAFIIKQKIILSSKNIYFIVTIPMFPFKKRDYPAPAWPATVRAPGACPASDGASPRHLPGRFLHSAHSLQPTRPHPVRCRFRPDPASSFNSQTRLPAPASLTLTSHGTHPRSSVSSRPGPGHARHTPVHAHSSGRLAWPLLREACVDTLAGGIRGQ